MAEQIGSQHGSEAVRQRLNKLDPGKTAYNKFFGATAPELIAGHNELLKRVAALEARLLLRPFS